MIRFFDFIFSLISLIFLMPLFIILAVLIKLDSKGPVLFKQIRVGKDGKDFTLFKFRSMFINAEQGGLITVGERDPRITKIGYFLRKYKIDELLQLVNVLIGDMSFVGPRPEVPRYVKLYSSEQRKILTVKPGITDYASIYFIQENELISKSNDPEKTYITVILPAKINYNMIFINNQTVSEYFKIILLTIRKLIFKF
ncbi:MAG TPA: sugar transferase [Tenuifilaceae bacterium]|nr:sugar transferase [Tenuifilaceae bacterium]